MRQVRPRAVRRTFVLTAACTMLAVSVVRTADRAAAAAPTSPRPSADAHIRNAYLELPMRFEPNAGRADGDIDFVARGEGYAVSLSARETRLMLDGTVPVTMRLVGSRANAVASPNGELPGRTNHVHGRDRRQWLTALPAYERVEYKSVYPGVDVVYYGNQRQLEYDFVVAPGASYRQIRLAFSGHAGLSIDDHGGLVIATARGDLVQRAPVIYQQDARGSRQVIEGGYVIGKDGRVGFRVGRYDRRRPLIIDPVLAYATYFGGSGGDEAASIAVDAAGDVYITGRTGSLDFPLRNAAQPVHGGPYYDAFVLKLNSAGDSLVYATYLGGSRDEYGADIYVDEAANAFVVGTTYSPDFPIVGGGQSSLAGHSDIFLTRLDSSGIPMYSTLLGGSDSEVASGLTVDALGRPYVTGWTISADLPLRNPIQATLGGSAAFKTTDGGGSWNALDSGLKATFVTSVAVDRHNPDTVFAAAHGYGVFKSTDGGASWTAVNDGLDDRYVWTVVLSAGAPATVYAGTETGLYRSVDAGASWQRIANINGRVSSIAGHPTDPLTLYATTTWTGVLKTVDGGDTWMELGPYYEQVTRIALSASSPSTIYAATPRGVLKNTTGGSDWTLMGDEFLLGYTHDVAVDPTNADIVYAATDDGLFRSLAGGAEWSLVGPFGQVLSVAIAPSDPSVLYVGHSLGAAVSYDRGENWGSAGLANVLAWTLTVDPGNPAVVYAGSTASIDGLLARFSADGATLEFSTYFGGASFDEIADVQVDAAGNVYLVGATASPDLPVRNAVQPQFGGVRDMFVAKLSPAWDLVYATYIGGAGWEHGTTLGVDAAGHVVVAGETYSRNFPLVNAFQPDFGGGYVDAFVAKLAPSGTSFVYATLLGGSGTEFLVTLALSPSGDVVVSGTTGSTNFPTVDPVQAGFGGGFIDFFVARFDASGALRFSTFLGGDGWEYNRRVAVTGDDRVWLAGDTHSTNFPTRNPLQATKSTFNDLAIARIDPRAPDSTPPVTTVRAAGDLGLAGWYLTPVTIELAASDQESGVASIEYSLNAGPWTPYVTPFSIVTSGAYHVHARATDTAGNVESVPVTASFNIDLDAPIVAITAPEARPYLHSELLTVGFSASDSASGIAGKPLAALDGTIVTNGRIVPLLTLPLGSHEFSVAAADLAGHGTKRSVTFVIVATIDSLRAAVEAYVASGAVDAKMAAGLLAKIEEARQALERGNLTAARNKLEDFIDQVTAQEGRGVTAGAAKVLVTDARYVIGTL